jgi:hypothetical protein
LPRRFGFGFFNGRKCRFPRGEDGGSSFFGIRKLIPGKPCRARGGAEARGKIKPRREVSDLEEDDDPIGFSVAISMETARFVGGDRLGPS